MDDKQLLDLYTSGGDLSQLSDADLNKLAQLMRVSPPPGRMPLTPIPSRGPASPLPVEPKDFPKALVTVEDLKQYCYNRFK